MSKDNLKVTGEVFKSRFSIQDFDYDDENWDAYKNPLTPKLSFREAYEVNYKKKGWLMDIEHDNYIPYDIYVILDCIHEFMVGDEVKIFGDWYYILDRGFDLENKVIVYRLLQADSNFCESHKVRNFTNLFNKIEKSFIQKLSSIFKNIPNGKD